MVVFVCLFVFVFLALAWRKPQSQVDNEGKNDRADDANGRALGVDGHCRKRTGGKSDDGDDDGGLSDWLGFYFEGKFHEQSQQQRGRMTGGLEGKSGRRRSGERKEPWTKTTTEVRVTDSPWFIGVGENLVVRK